MNQTTTLADAAELIRPLAKAAKEEAIRTIGDDTMLSFVAGIRAGRPVVRITATELTDGKRLLSLASGVATYFSPDIVALAQDTFSATTQLNPMTGKDWGPNEMGIVAHEHHGIERGFVYEQITVMSANRADDHLVRMMPFIRGHRKIVWRTLASVFDRPESELSEEDLYFGGFVPEELRKIMNQKTFDQALLSTNKEWFSELIPELEAANAMEPGKRQDSMDMAAAIHCFRHIGDARIDLIADEGSERQELLLRIRSHLRLPIGVVSSL